MTLANTGLRDRPILTPSVCSYILSLKEKAVFRQVSKINFFKNFFVKCSCDFFASINAF